MSKNKNVTEKSVVKFYSLYNDRQFNPNLFFSILRLFLIGYFLYFFYNLDWSIYQISKSNLFKPIEGLGMFVSNMPSSRVLSTLLAAHFIFGGLSLFKYGRKFSFLLFSLLTIYLDILHNSFGFVNVQSHAIFFLLICNLYHWTEPQKNSKKDLFLALELVYTLVYFQSAISKLIKSGFAWGLDGTTLQIGMFRQLQPLGVELSQYSTICIGLSLFTIILELLFPFIYFLLKDKRPILILSILFHLCTFIFMGIGFFHLWMLPLSCIIALLPRIVDLKSRGLNWS